MCGAALSVMHHKCICGWHIIAYCAYVSLCVIYDFNANECLGMKHKLAFLPLEGNWTQVNGSSTQYCVCVCVCSCVWYCVVGDSDLKPWSPVCPTHPPCGSLPAEITGAPALCPEKEFLSLSHTCVWLRPSGSWPFTCTYHPRQRKISTVLCRSLLLRWCPTCLFCHFPSLGDVSRWSISKSLLPMFSTKSFLVSHLI